MPCLQQPRLGGRCRQLAPRPPAPVACHRQPLVAKRPQPRPQQVPVEEAIRKRLLRKQLNFSDHARCRLEERVVLESQILEVLQQGSVNKRLSQFGGAKSPSYCMELHVGHPPRLLRVVFAQSPDATLVVTAAWREEAGP